jgi:hypothetical protein
MTDPYNNISSVDLAYKRTILSIKEEYFKQKIKGYKHKTIVVMLSFRYPKLLIQQALKE